MARHLRILGAGGHGRVAAAAWRSSGGQLAGFHDDRPPAAGSRLEACYLGAIETAFANEDALHIAIGDNRVRRRLAEGVADARFPRVVHAAAMIAVDSAIGPGTLVCAAAVIQTDAAIGRHAIVNTAAVVEHDCTIADFVHIAPGVRLGGGATVGAGAFVGLGAMILPGITIGEAAVVGAGAVVIRDVPPGVTVAGNPARPLAGR